MKDFKREYHDKISAIQKKLIAKKALATTASSSSISTEALELSLRHEKSSPLHQESLVHEEETVGGRPPHPKVNSEKVSQLEKTVHGLLVKVKEVRASTAPLLHPLRLLTDMSTAARRE
jgi:hypothetical protein